MIKQRTPLVIEVTRGSAVESVHHVMAVVSDERQTVAGFIGNVDYLTFPRSAIKMLQAIPFVESGAIEKFGLDDRMLALACASHRGEKQHLVVTAQWMEKLKVGEGSMACGPDWPQHEATKHEMIRKGLAPSPMLHNCSGKHLGIISTCMARGENPLGYHKHEHPAQVRLRKLLSEFGNLNYEKLPWGIDGCGIPTFAMPLQNLAFSMSHLLARSASAARRSAVERIIDACRRHPQLLSGSEDFSAVVMEKTHGRLLLKGGAEGVYAGVLLDRGQAFALKVHDGHRRAAEVACAFLLRALGALSETEFSELRAFTMPEVKNSRGEKVGEIRPQKGS